MPRAEWTAKQDRKYEHIVESERDQGRSTGRAKEIAARTINKERAQRGQTKTASRSSTDDMSSSRRGGLRSGKPGPRGRTRLNTAQLLRAVDAKKEPGPARRRGQSARRGDRPPSSA